MKICTNFCVGSKSTTSYGNSSTKGTTLSFVRLHTEQTYMHANRASAQRADSCNSNKHVIGEKSNKSLIFTGLAEEGQAVLLQELHSWPRFRARIWTNIKRGQSHGNRANNCMDMKTPTSVLWLTPLINPGHFRGPYSFLGLFSFSILMPSHHDAIEHLTFLHTSHGKSSSIYEHGTSVRVLEGIVHVACASESLTV